MARPPSRLYEFQKTVQRHWVGFAAGLAILVTLACGVVVSALEAVRARRAEREQTDLRVKAQAAQAAEAAQRDRAEAGERLGQRRLYAAKMNLAQAAWEENHVGRVRQLLEETASYPERGFEWFYWQRQTHLELKTLRGHLDQVWAVAFSPDRRRVVTGSRDRTAKVWDAASGQELFTLTGHLEAVSAAAFSPDGRRIITGSLDGTGKVWDAATGTELRTLQGHRSTIWGAAFSPDSRRVVTGRLGLHRPGVGCRKRAATLRS